MRKATLGEKEMMKKYYQKNKETIKKRSGEWHLKNLIKAKENFKKNYLKNQVERVLKQRKYYYENKDKILKKHSEFAKENRDIMNLKNLLYKKRHPEKVKARDIAKYRVKIPQGQVCVLCNKNIATDRHHDDYSKPLDVKFVCRSCNNKMERRIGI